MRSFLLLILTTISLITLNGCTDNSNEVVQPETMTTPAPANPQGSQAVNVTSPDSGTGHQQNYQNAGMGNAAKMISPALQ